MRDLTFTLVTDGSSDVVLLPILTWLLRTNGVALPLQGRWADTRRVHLPRRATLSERIHLALDLYPCELLFIHRDAEREPRDLRVAEIQEALHRLPPSSPQPTAVCVVPVRMQEAWLLFDEMAIKVAAGNRTFRENLNLPMLKDMELLPDPKSALYDCLRRASGLHGRRLQSFPVGQRARRVADLIEDFSPLRALPAFGALEEDVKEIMTRLHLRRDTSQPPG
ncbi:MAG: hypothetical protein IPO15_27665 [Anaerolineae bacterium]|nr:hypothetical protein [Anaerolineae bacterium]MBK9094417.1 hypothetical protein [Anaerolineae bacterium]MBK9234493.1 hypothetical protein [Anaerolineae bacterium]